MGCDLIGFAAVLWAITSYYNPAGYRTRLANYRRFRDALTVPLVAVEASMGGPFELEPGDAEVLVQRNGASVLWQKERLLNIALEHLPPECDTVAWLDCDVILEDEHWAERAQEALCRHALVHLFSQRVDLGSTRNGLRASLGARLAEGTAAPVELLTAAEGWWSLTAGLAWASRRSTAGELGFYDACILGGGDHAMICAALGEFPNGIAALQMNDRQAGCYLAWAGAVAQAIHGRIGFLPGTALHLWHGDLAERQYHVRQTALAPYDFDPAADIEVAPSGCWAWSSDKPELHAFVRSYFEARREDG